MTLLEMMPYGTMCRTAHQKVPFHVNTTLKTILQDDWILDLCCKKREIGLAAIKTGRSVARFFSRFRRLRCARASS
jgi:hypothetical protein